MITDNRGGSAKCDIVIELWKLFSYKHIHTRILFIKPSKRRSSFQASHVKIFYNTDKDSSQGPIALIHKLSKCVLLFPHGIPFSECI